MYSIAEPLSIFGYVISAIDKARIRPISRQIRALLEYTVISKVHIILALQALLLVILLRERRPLSQKRRLIKPRLLMLLIVPVYLLR